MAAPAGDIPLPELTPQTYVNRELSWIEFNSRVLAMAQDESVPLLERVKFLAIFSNNLDEFYMVRVASVHDKAKVLVSSARPDGYQAGPLLDGNPQSRHRFGRAAANHHARNLRENGGTKYSHHGNKPA